MNLEEVLKNLLTEERLNPKDDSTKQFRAYYQLDDKKLPLSGWFSSAKLALDSAKSYLEGGLLDGKVVDFKNEDGTVEELVSDDKYIKYTDSGILDKLKSLFALGGLGAVGAGLGNVKDAVANFFNLNDGKLSFRGTEEEIADGLFTSFGGFLDNASLEEKENNVTLLENSVKVAKRLGKEEFSLDDVSSLLNNPNKEGEKLVTRLVNESTEELKEENNGLKNWFLNKYYTSGMNNKLFKSTSLLRDKFADLAVNAKTGDLSKLGLVAGTGLGLSQFKNLFKKPNVDVPELGGVNVPKVEGVELNAEVPEVDVNLNRNIDVPELGDINAPKVDGVELNANVPEVDLDLNKNVDVPEVEVEEGDNKGLGLGLAGTAGVAAGVGALKNLGKDAVDAVKDGASNLATGAVDATTNAVEGVKGLGADIGDKVTDLATGAADTVKSGVDEVKDDLSKLGAGALGVGSGVVEGVKSVGSNLKDKALDLGNGAEATINKGVDAITGRDDDDNKKKGGFGKKLALGAGVAGLASLPFWAIPYGINPNLPSDATVSKELPSSYRFYENVELPEVTKDGYTFDGWYSDEAFNNKVDNIHFGLGTKNLYPKLTENETASVAPEKEEEKAEDANEEPAVETAPAKYTLYNQTGENLTDVYLYENGSSDKGENLADRFHGASATIDLGELPTDKVFTLEYKTEGGREGKFDTLHVEEAPIQLLAEDAKTGATDIAFSVPENPAKYTLYNSTGEDVKELYIYPNGEDKGTNHAGDGLANGANVEVDYGNVPQDTSYTVEFTTASGYKGKFDTLHVEEAPIELIAEDDMTGATQIRFSKPENAGAGASGANAATSDDSAASSNNNDANAASNSSGASDSNAASTSTSSDSSSSSNTSNGKNVVDTSVHK